jgi:F-type H+-transporting ATPase subunit b
MLHFRDGRFAEFFRQRVRLHERFGRLDELRAELEKAADQPAPAAREAARSQVSSAVTTVASKAAELATGRTPDTAAVQQAVAAAMESAGSR